jgi:elongation factor Ts
MVTAQEVKKLRDMTGAGMLDCKKALQEADGDFDEAVDILRKKGQKVSSKRSEREANEGIVVTILSEDRKEGTIVEVNCETDFVARNDEFQAFANGVAELVHEKRPADLEALHELTMENGRTVQQNLHELMGKIGEKLTISRFDRLEATDGELVSYVHPGSKLGVLVEVSGNGQRQDVGRDVAMQVAAMDPVAVRRENVDADVVERERSIARETAENEGKPDHIIERIVDGKINKFYEDRVLLEQDFVKDSSRTVAEMLEEQEVAVDRYVRYALGD